MPATATTVDWSNLRQSTLGTRERRVVLPSSVATLIRALALFPDLQSEESEPVDFQKLQSIVESDSRFHNEVERQLQFNHFDRPILPASQGPSLIDLGATDARRILISSGLHAVKSFSKSKLINGRNFWASNHERALFAWEVAELLHADPFLAFTAAMVQDFLLPYLTTEFFNDYLRFVETPEAEAVELAVFERKTFGWHHARAAAGVMASWGFPDDLTCCVLFHHGGLGLLKHHEMGRTAAAAVAVAALVPESIGQVPNGLQQLAYLHERWAQFDLLRIAQRVDQRLAHIERRRLNHIPLLRRCRKVLSERPRAIAH